VQPRKRRAVPTGAAPNAYRCVLCRQITRHGAGWQLHFIVGHPLGAGPAVEALAAAQQQQQQQVLMVVLHPGVSVHIFY
jgi:hypothetical protein